MNNLLKKQAIIATFWSFVERFSQQGFTFITGIILARLLGPKQFGIVAMVSIFIQISQVFIDSGFGKSLIQKKDIKKIDIDSVFFLGVFIALIVSSILIVSAKTIANFYNEPVLVKIIPVLTISLIFMSLRQVQQSLLSKELDFKKQFKINTFSKFISAVTGISLAFLGYGVWALVFQQLIGNFITTVLFWIYVSWKPSLQFSFLSIKRLFKFGSNLMISAIIRTVVDNGYGLVIGKVFSAYDLGIYNRARNLMRLTVLNVTQAIQKTTFPMFSKINDDKVALKKAIKRSLQLIFFFLAPILMLLIILAKYLILFLLTEKWINVIPYFQLLCIVGFFEAISGINMHLLLAIGKSSKALKIIVVKYSIQLMMLILTYHYGILFIIYGQIASSIINIYFNTYYTNIYIDFGFYKQLVIIFPIILNTFFVGTIIYISSNILFVYNNFIQLMLFFLIGIFLYLIINFILKNKILLYLIENVKNIIT